MLLKRAWLFFCLLGAFGLYLLVLTKWAAPGAVFLSRLITGTVPIRYVRVVHVRAAWDSGGFGTPGSTVWNTALSGGPLGSRTEVIEFDSPTEKFLHANGRFHVGAVLPVVQTAQGRWVPTAYAKSTAIFGPSGLSLVALAIVALVIRGSLGPKAFPDRYEPATFDIGSSINGLPTRRPATIVAIGLLGCLLMGVPVVANPSWYLRHGATVAYWLGLIEYLMFVGAGPIMVWAVLPRLGRVQPA
jgi:hypothetical protein